MSPLIFLAIPLVIFVIGSTVLYVTSRFRGDRMSMRNAPHDLRTMAPMVADQREAGWQVSNDRNVRS